MAVNYRFLIKPIVLQYKQLFNDDGYRNDFFNILKTNAKQAEFFCKKIIKQAGFSLLKEPMNNLTYRDIALIKALFEMYCRLITENTEENVSDLSNLWLNKTKDFLLQCGFFMKVNFVLKDCTGSSALTLTSMLQSYTHAAISKTV